MSTLVVDDILLDDGAVVEKGQVVVRLSAPGLQEELDLRKQELEEQRESLSELLNMPPEELGRANVSQGITLRAPIGGRVMNLNAEEGTKLEKDSVVANIVDDSSFRITARVTPGTFEYVSMNQPVKLRIPGYSGTVDAVVTDINPDPVPEARADLEIDCANPEPAGAADEYTMVYWVTIEGENPGLVQPGMALEVGFVEEDAGEQSIRWAYYCARVESFGAEQTVLCPTEAVATRVFVHERETIKAGDPLLALSGDDAREAIREELDELRQLELELEQLRKQQTQLDVAAPMSGTIADIHVEEGQEIHPGEWLGHVYNTEEMQLWVQVDDVDVVLVHQGAPVTVTVQAVPGKEFKGEVVHVSQTGRDETGVVQFGVRIDVQGGPELRPGMQGQAHIDAGSAEEVLLVPLEAVFEEDGQAKVELLKGGTPRVVPVELGLMNDRVAEVKEGVEAGDLVITGSSADLLPSQTIRDDSVLPGDDSGSGDNGEGSDPEGPN